MSRSVDPSRSSLPPPRLPRELWARARIHTLREELGGVGDPRVLGALEFELGGLYEHILGDRERAEECYLRARHRQPSHLPALFALVRGRAPAAALPVWDTIAQKSERTQDRAAALCEAGLAAYDELDDRTRAVAAWSEALAIDPACATAALLLEQHARASGNEKEADRFAALHERALAGGEIKGALLLELAAKRVRDGKREQALELLAEACRTGVSRHAVWWQIECTARASEQTTLLAPALIALADELAAGETEPERARAAALLRQASELSLDGEKIFERALALQPKDGLLLWERMLRHEAKGAAQLAEADARTLLAEAGAGPLASALRVRLAQRLLAQNKTEAALRELAGTLADEPRAIAATALLEDTLVRLGQKDALRERLLVRAEQSHGDARAERLLQAGRLALQKRSDPAAALELLHRASASSSRTEGYLRGVYGAAVFAGADRVAVAAAATLCTTELADEERTFLRFDQYQRLRRGLRDHEAARALLGVALNEPANRAWAPYATRVEAALLRDYALLADAHRALAAQTEDETEAAAHLCASARALLRKGQPDAAADELRLSLARAPDDAYALALLEECLLLSGGEREVARLLRENAQTHVSARQRELSLLNAGSAAEAIGDVDAAARSYEEAAERDPSSLGPLWALLRLGERSDDLGMVERARRKLAAREEQLAQGDQYALALGELLFARGREAEASAVFGKVLGRGGGDGALTLCLCDDKTLPLALHDRARSTLQATIGAELPLLRDGVATHLERDPSTGRALLGAALAEHAGDTWLAFKALETSAHFDLERAERWQQLARQSDDPALAAELTLHAVRCGLLSGGAGASEDGLLRALQAAAHAPDSLAAAVALDETLGAGDDADSRAVALFGRLTHASPELSRPLRAARARALLAAGRMREAADTARRALQDDANDLGALETLRCAARGLSDFAQAADAAERLAESAHGKQRALLLEEAALLYERELSQPARAEACLWAALEHDPGSELAFARLHDLLLDRRDTEALIALIARRLVVGLDPASEAELRYEHALILRAAGRKPEAVSEIGRVLALDPDHAAAIGLWVETCTALEQWEEAVRALRKLALANVPPSQKRLARIGAAEYLERKLSDLAGACAELEALSAAGIRDAGVLVKLGGLYERRGRYRPAVGAYREAANASPARARAELERRAGDVLRIHLGASNEAIAAYERALHANALDEEACAQLLALTEDREERARIVVDFESALRAALEREPAEAELLRLLRRTGVWAMRKDLELVALSALCTLGYADANERHDKDALREAASPAPHPSQAESVLEALASSLIATPFSRIAQFVSLGLAALEQAAPAALALDNLRALSSEQRFETGRRAMALRLGVSPLLTRARAARRDALRAGVVLAGVGTGSAEIEALARQFGKQLARAQRKELTRLCAQLERSEVQLDAYLDLLENALLRAGLLFADDLVVAWQHVEGVTGSDPGSVANAPRALELLRFWISPRLLELRDELGFGP